MVKLVDTHALGACGAIHVGSSPAACTETMLNFEETILQTIKQAHHVLVVADIKSTPSNGAAATALVSGLRQAGIQADFVANASLDASWSVLGSIIQPNLELPSEDFIISLNLSRTKVGQVKYKIEGDKLKFFVKPNGGQFTEEDVELIFGRPPYDLIITIGVAAPEVLGEIYNQNSGLFYQTPIINIDCQVDNENYGQVNLVDLVASSTAEIVYDLFRALDWHIDADVATYLLAGLIYETKNFTNTKATPQVLVAAANLIKEGARREAIVNEWYASVELSTLHLWGKILLNLEQTEDGLVWSKLDSNEVVPSVSLIRQAIERLLIGLQDAKVIAVFYNLASAQPTVSLSLLKNQGSLKEVNKSLERASSETGTGVVVYATGAINLQSWLQDFSPVGSEHFVTFTSNLPLSSTMELILPILSQRLAEIK